MSFPLPIILFGTSLLSFVSLLLITTGGWKYHIFRTYVTARCEVFETSVSTEVCGVGESYDSCFKAMWKVKLRGKDEKKQKEGIIFSDGELNYVDAFRQTKQFQVKVLKYFC